MVRDAEQHKKRDLNGRGSIKALAWDVCGRTAITTTAGGLVGLIAGTAAGNPAQSAYEGAQYGMTIGAAMSGAVVALCAGINYTFYRGYQSLGHIHKDPSPAKQVLAKMFREVYLRSTNPRAAARLEIIDDIKKCPTTPPSPNFLTFGNVSWIVATAGMYTGLNAVLTHSGIASHEPTTSTAIMGLSATILCYKDHIIDSIKARQRYRTYAPIIPDEKEERESLIHSLIRRWYPPAPSQKNGEITRLITPPNPSKVIPAQYTAK